MYAKRRNAEISSPHPKKNLKFMNIGCTLPRTAVKARMYAVSDYKSAENSLSGDVGQSIRDAANLIETCDKSTQKGKSKFGIMKEVPTPNSMKAGLKKFMWRDISMAACVA